MTDITELVASEIADFCAGLGSTGEPETPEQIQRELMERIIPLIKDKRREWMARGIDQWVCARNGRWNGTTKEAQEYASMIRDGEVE